MACVIFMLIHVPKIHHLIRYFLFVGCGAFALYAYNILPSLMLPVMAPCLFLAAAFKNFICNYVTYIGADTYVLWFGILLPVTLLYFGIMSFLLKQLWNERGPIRFFSVAVLIIFLLYVHYTSWKQITPYLM